MAPPVEWSPEAVEDVEAIAAWIERDSPAYARAVVGRIVDRAASFAIFPERGRIVPELGDAAVRERFVHGWRLIYRVERARVLILAVIHGRRLLDPDTDRQGRE